VLNAVTRDDPLPDFTEGLFLSTWVPVVVGS
jgi:hypothetical protein